MILDERSAAVFISAIDSCCSRSAALAVVISNCSSGSSRGGKEAHVRRLAARRCAISGFDLKRNSWTKPSLPLRPASRSISGCTLRDTRRYSLFLEPAGKVAYGTLGITEPIKQLVGDAGALIETGLLLYDGRIVCDGLISSLVWIGPSYRRSYNEALSNIRSAGNFHTDRLVSSSKQESVSCCG